MKKMVFCGFMSAMCMVAVGVEKPAGAKAPGEKPRVEAKKPGDAAKPTAAGIPCTAWSCWWTIGSRRRR